MSKVKRGNSGHFFSVANISIMSKLIGQFLQKQMWLAMEKSTTRDIKFCENCIVGIDRREI